MLRMGGSRRKEEPTRDKNGIKCHRCLSHQSPSLPPPPSPVARLYTQPGDNVLLSK